MIKLDINKGDTILNCKIQKLMKDKKVTKESIKINILKRKLEEAIGKKVILKENILPYKIGQQVRAIKDIWDPYNLPAAAKEHGNQNLSWEDFYEGYVKQALNIMKDEIWVISEIDSNSISLKKKGRTYSEFISKNDFPNLFEVL